MSGRVYLDWNATTPLLDASRDAMIAAMDAVGNPSSVHSEGRVSKGIIEKARAQLSDALGASNADIVFTSSATEAAALAMAGRDLHCADIEHDAVSSWATADLLVDQSGIVTVQDPQRSALQLANSETGVVQDLPHGLAMTDLTQAFGKLPLAFSWLNADMAIVSAHKLGGPKGVGALILKQGLDVESRIKGGGQEMGRRSGTENLIGIAGFGAAAQAAMVRLADGAWDRVATLRDLLEASIANSAPGTIFVGAGGARLPNTSCFATPGWKGETQVMQMDLAGFAVSAGSACSSGKVKASRVLRAMGYDDDFSSSALRVSLGPDTTEHDVMAFADAWARSHSKFRAKAA